MIVVFFARDARHDARAHAVHAVRHALLGDPRRPDARPVRRRHGSGRGARRRRDRTADRSHHASDRRRHRSGRRVVAPAGDPCPRPRHDLVRDGGTRAARRDRDRDDGLAAVRFHPRVGRRQRGRIRLGRAERDAAARGGGRCRRHRDDLLQRPRARGVRDRGQPLPARRTRDDAGARAAHVHAAMRAREESESVPETVETGPDPVVPRAMVGAGETL